MDISGTPCSGATRAHVSKQKISGQLPSNNIPVHLQTEFPVWYQKIFAKIFKTKGNHHVLQKETVLLNYTSHVSKN